MAAYNVAAGVRPPGDHSFVAMACSTRSLQLIGSFDSVRILAAAVREIGASRTSAYSNLIPIVAMFTAILFLGEPVVAGKLAGTAAVLTGVALTRVGRKTALPPAEE